MEECYEQEYLEAEKSNVWFIRRKELVFEFIKKIDRNSKILEVGCGSGYILDYFQKKGFKDVFGYDPSKTFFKYHRNVKKSTSFPKGKNEFDVVLLLDVIEHVKDEKEMLRKINGVMKKGGTFLVSAPAYEFLWSYQDELNKHYRRYTEGSLSHSLNDAGFKTMRGTYWNSTMFLPILLMKKFQNLLNVKKSNMALMPGWFDFIYKSILKIEILIIKSGVNLPFGTSVFVLSKKN